jgi:hypothetical protein
MKCLTLSNPLICFLLNKKGIEKTEVSNQWCTAGALLRQKEINAVIYGETIDEE